MKTNILVLLLFSLLLGACTPQLSTFTRSIYSDQNLSDSDLKQIQFFLSHDLVLYRFLTEKGNVHISDGAVRIKNGKKTEEIVIKGGTPGVFVSRPKEDHFTISFEGGEAPRTLTFGPNPKRNGQYELLASEWNGRNAIVTYGDEKYNCYLEAIPSLLFELKRTGTHTTKRSTAQGRKVGN